MFRQKGPRNNREKLAWATREGSYRDMASRPRSGHAVSTCSQKELKQVIRERELGLGTWHKPPGSAEKLMIESHTREGFLNFAGYPDNPVSPRAFLPKK